VRYRRSGAFGLRLSLAAKGRFIAGSICFCSRHRSVSILFPSFARIELTPHSTGLLNAVSQFSGILGPQLFRTDYAPRYHNSIIASLVFVAIAFATVGLLWYLMEGDLSWSPYLTRSVLSQTQVTEEDEDAAKRGETIETTKLEK